MTTADFTMGVDYLIVRRRPAVFFAIAVIDASTSWTPPHDTGNGRKARKYYKAYFVKSNASLSRY
ncbi:MAG TPA: hypothetical protein VM820_10295 [Vicinamibacterales bacterium]|jgi:hypothetical protein|nr:hypothetical protein [Vicinamibacterales bacterium]